MRAYHDDASWLGRLAEYANFTRRELDDFLACFFADCATSPLPAWARDPESPAYAARRDALCRERGWHRALPLCRLVHYELMAREAYKAPLHVEWLETLGVVVRPGEPFRVLDYGCGVGSFGNLALAFDEVHCTLADVDPELVKYLECKHRDLGARVRIHPLSQPLQPRANLVRVPVDSRSVSGSYDAIVLADVLEHLLDPLRVLRHLLSLLRPGGLVLVNYPHEIDGDWHTPEAFYLRRWCYLLLRACARHVRPHTLQMRHAPWTPALLRLARACNPALYRRAMGFARAHFRQHGEELADAVRSLAQREVTSRDLLESIVDWPCSDAPSLAWR
jgi:2-polyprenyl-3-methyl-5-hydroxy-6-metoxy-1,4-benzoquinol methylase